MDEKGKQVGSEKTRQRCTAPQLAINFVEQTSTSSLALGYSLFVPFLSRSYISLHAVVQPWSPLPPIYPLVGLNTGSPRVIQKTPLKNIHHPRVLRTLCTSQNPANMIGHLRKCDYDSHVNVSLRLAGQNGVVTEPYSIGSRTSAFDIRISKSRGVLG